MNNIIETIGAALYGAGIKQVIAGPSGIAIAIPAKAKSNTKAVHVIATEAGSFNMVFFGKGITRTNDVTLEKIADEFTKNTGIKLAA